MTRLICRFTRSLHFVAALGLLTVCIHSASAQTSEDVSYIGVIEGTDVYVRCGAAESYYPFAKVNAGDLVKVTGEKYEWIRVGTIGPAFKHAFGYVKYAKGDAGRFRLAQDGKSGVTLGRIEIIAPNLETSNDHKESWKSILRFEADQTLRVLETMETEKDIIHKVALPETAQGWISRAYVGKATDAQTEQWKQMLAAKPAPENKPAASNASTPGNASASGQVAPVNSESTSSASNQPKSGTTPEGTTSEAAPGMPADSAEPGTSITAAPAIEAPAPKPAEPKLPTLEDLESAFKLLQKEDIVTAEVMPLRELYIDLANRSVSEPRVARYSKGRAEQLQIWADAQKRRMELESVRSKSRMSAEETDAVRKALESSAEYVAVGRVAASTIYDGERLPKLLRLQDAGTGRAIAYLQPDEKYEVVNLIGNVVGIVGEKTYDEVLRLNIIKPGRIDILTPAQQAVAAPVQEAPVQN